MKWEKKGQMHIDSACGAFRINKAFVHGQPIYQAARVIPPPAVIVMGRGTLDACKQACEETK